MAPRGRPIRSAARPYAEEKLPELGRLKGARSHGQVENRFLAKAHRPNKAEAVPSGFEAFTLRSRTLLGGESEGIGREVAALADTRLTIPMANGVESLNVAVTAALVSFHLGQVSG